MLSVSSKIPAGDSNQSLTYLTEASSACCPSLDHHSYIAWNESLTSLMFDFCHPTIEPMALLHDLEWLSSSDFSW
jgi:hypothetical protein